MTEGLLDTPVVIDLRSHVDRDELLPHQAYVSALTLAEIVQGPLFAGTDADRGSRDRVVLDAHRAFPEPIGFDAACVPAYRSIAALTVEAGRQPRRRTLELLIAATAQAHGLPPSTPRTPATSSTSPTSSRSSRSEVCATRCKIESQAGAHAGPGRRIVKNPVPVAAPVPTA